MTQVCGAANSISGSSLKQTDLVCDSALGFHIGPIHSVLWTSVKITKVKTGSNIKFTHSKKCWVKYNQCWG